MLYTIELIASAVAPIFTAYGVEAVYLFGSYARREATEKSDVDFVVRIGDIPFDLFDLAGLRQDLEERLKKNVDLVTTGGLEYADPAFVERIAREEIVIYEAKRPALSGAYR